MIRVDAHGNVNFEAVYAHGNVNFEAPPKPRYGPPSGWVRPAMEYFNAAEDWARLVERGLQFESYSGPMQLHGVRGDCLEPLIIAGRHMLKVRPVASDEPLLDGGLYCIEWDNDDEIQAYRDKIGIQGKEQIVIAKFLRYLGGGWECQCKDSITTLNGVVVGMVVGVISAAGCTGAEAEVHARSPMCSNPFDAESAECAQLNANAVSQIASVYSNSSVFMTAQVGATNPDTVTLETITLTCTGVPIAIDAFVVASGGHSASGTCSAGILRVLRDGSALTASQYDISALVNAASVVPTAVTLTLADAPAAGSHTYTIQASITATGASGQFVQYNVVQVFLKVREYKR